MKDYRYTPPEQECSGYTAKHKLFKDDVFYYKGDVWSLGLIIYETCGGYSYR